MTPGVRVIKLGGSLLEWDGLVPGFRNWLALQTKAVNIMVVGGGPLVDALRKLDRRHQFPPETVHLLAIHLMDVSGQLVAGLFDDAILVGKRDQLRLINAPGLQVLQVLSWIDGELGAPDALPIGWQVTSDSITARVANTLSAKELVLLKSALPDGAATRQACAESGYVDAYFPQAAGSLTVRCVNLRSAEFAEVMVE